MHTVAAVIDQGALTFDLAIPCEIFGLDRRDIVDPWYGFKLVAAGGEPVTTQTGFVLRTAYGLADLENAGTVIVPGWSDPEQRPSLELCMALWAARERGARIVSLCTGAFVLAAAGLLDGRRVTTHWLYADRLAAWFPDVTVDTQPLYVADDGIYTSAGTAAGIDLCLHLVALDHGMEVAATVARRLVMPLHRPGGQAQYVDRPIASERSAGELDELLGWARARLGAGIGLDDLARHAAISPRSLTRRFARCIGASPGEWLAAERVRLAQRLLEQTDDAIELVARRSGYASTATMRAQFSARLGTSPAAYRRTFRAPRDVLAPTAARP
jgi:AraC family transcriptional regulator, transcriptional activator FtrA